MKKKRDIYILVITQQVFYSAKEANKTEEISKYLDVVKEGNWKNSKYRCLKEGKEMPLEQNVWYDYAPEDTGYYTLVTENTWYYNYDAYNLSVTRLKIKRICKRLYNKYKSIIEKYNKIPS